MRNSPRYLRGYLPDKGWLHSAAHTADLVRFLGRSRHLTVAEQKRILDVVAGKLEAPVFVWGEDERLARLRCLCVLLGGEERESPSRARARAGVLASLEAL